MDSLNTYTRGNTNAVHAAISIATMIHVPWQHWCHLKQTQRKKEGDWLEQIWSFASSPDNRLWVGGDNNAILDHMTDHMISPSILLPTSIQGMSGLCCLNSSYQWPRFLYVTLRVVSNTCKIKNILYNAKIWWMSHLNQNGIFNLASQSKIQAWLLRQWRYIHR